MLAIEIYESIQMHLGNNLLTVLNKNVKILWELDIFLNKHWKLIDLMRKTERL